MINIDKRPSQRSIHAYSDVQTISEEMQSWNRLTAWSNIFPPKHPGANPFEKNATVKLDHFLQIGVKIWKSLKPPPSQRLSHFQTFSLFHRASHWLSTGPKVQIVLHPPRCYVHYRSHYLLRPPGKDMDGSMADVDFVSCKSMAGYIGIKYVCA